MFWFTLIACIELPQLVAPDPSCPDRVPHYPDADGDGIGEPDAVYVGCTPPSGWVVVPPPARDPGDTGDTGAQGG